MRKVRSKWIMLGVHTRVDRRRLCDLSDQATTRKMTQSKSVGASFLRQPQRCSSVFDKISRSRSAARSPVTSSRRIKAAQVVKLARESIKFPASGKLVGDSKVGDQLAHDGAGDRIPQFGQLEQEDKRRAVPELPRAGARRDQVGHRRAALTGYGPQRRVIPKRLRGTPREDL